MKDREDFHERARQEGVSAHLILKDSIHYLVLDYFFQRGIFPQLVFQGGTALRICYQGIRYSEDLDFVLNQGAKARRLFRTLSKVLEGLPGHLERSALFIESASLKFQKDAATFKRFTLAVKAEGFQALDKTNLEIAAVPSYENQSLLIRMEDRNLSPAVSVETPREILSDKLCAFGTRDYIKGRDLWDIHYLTRDLGGVADTRVRQMTLKKIADYRVKRSNFVKEFKNRISKLSQEGAEILKTEMNRFLPVSYRRMFQSKYSEICIQLREVLENFYDTLL